MQTRPRTRCLPALLATVVICLAGPALGQTISYVSKPAAVGSGLQSATILARLSTSAHGGVTVRVQSDSPTLGLISQAELTPGSAFVDIFVPNGSIDALFWIQALEDTTGTITITASATGFANGVTTVDIATPAVQITGLGLAHNILDLPDEFQTQVGLPLGGLLSPVQKVRAGGPGLTATLTNSNPSVAELVTTLLTAQVITVAIVPGQSASPATVASGGVAFHGIGAGATVVSASIPGFIAVTNATRNVSVAAASIAFTGLPGNVGIGLQKGNLLARLSGTEHGGTTVRIESTDSSAVLLSLDRFTLGAGFIDTFIPNGSLQTIFYAQVLDTAMTGPVNVTASAPGFITGNGAVSVVNPFFRISSLLTSHSVLDPIDEFTFNVGLPNLAQTLILETQEARGGGPGITMTAISSDSTVGVLESLGGRNDSLIVWIAPGDALSKGTIATGGVGFDGVGGGVTQVTGFSPGFFPVASGIVTVSVSQPGIDWVNLPAEGVGAGLQSVAARAQLQASAHGGVTVHIASRDSNLVLVSASDATAGSGSIDVFVPNGSTDAFFYLQGIEDTTGTVILYAGAPQFKPDSTVVDLVIPAIRITPGSLTNSIDTLNPRDEFSVSVGVISGLTFANKEVRPGSSGVLVSVVVDTSLAQLQTTASTGDSVTVVIAEQLSTSPATVALGGVGFKGLAPGVATVSVSAPGFISGSAATQTVTVTAPTLDFLVAAGADVGAGLQSNQSIVQLSTPMHGGVTVHIESANSALSLAAVSSTSAGAPSIDIAVPNGNSIAFFFIQGMDGATGTVQYTASAPGFVPDDVSIDIVQPAVEIVSLSTAIDVADGPNPFQARVGTPVLNQSAVDVVQARRGGAPPLVVSLKTSDSLVSQLRAGIVTSDSVAVSIAAGASVSPATLMAGGVEHRPQAAGQTLVTAAIPGFIQTGAGQRLVNITNHNVFIAGVAGRLGAGLQTPVLTAQVGESNHGGVTMHIEVNDPSKALISPNALAVGTGAMDVPLANGSTDVAFYVQAHDSSLGSVIVTASVTGFASAIETIQIVAPGTEITLLADSIAVADNDDEFLVRVGAVNSDSSGIVEPQGVWAGSDTLRVTVTSSDIAVGETVNSFTSGAAVVVSIPPGDVQTAQSVITGGVAFHPVGGGPTVVKGAAPDFVTTEAGSTTVYVKGTATAITLPAPEFSLQANIPNPFNPTTTIRFTLPARALVRLAVFDVRGRRVTTLVDREMPAGISSVEWNGREGNGNPASSGVYFYRIVTGQYVAARKMILLK